MRQFRGAVMNEAPNGSPGRWAAIKREAGHGLVLFLYLWALLGLFVLNEDIATRKAGELFIFQGFALLNALVLAKVMMLTEYLELARGLTTRPRIWTVLFEAAACTLMFLLVHTLQRVLLGLAHGQSLSTSMPVFGGGGVSGLLIVALIFFVSLLPFFTFKAVALAIGPEKMRAILFGH